MKTKIGTEFPRDSDTTFKVKQGHTGRGILWRPAAQLVYLHGGKLVLLPKVTVDVDNTKLDNDVMTIR